MTAQMSDRVALGDRDYALAQVEGRGLFEPSEEGLRLFPRCTACWRGFVCYYEVEADELLLGRLWVALREPEGEGSALRGGPAINGIRPTAPREPTAGFNAVYEELGLRVCFTGEMLIGDGFIRELYVHMGFHPAWKYQEVLRLTFEQGGLIECQDVSAEMAELRSHRVSAPPAPAG